LIEEVVADTEFVGTVKVFVGCDVVVEMEEPPVCVKPEPLEVGTPVPTLEFLLLANAT